MDSVKQLLVLCTFLSAIRLYESAATVTFKIDPVRPSLTSDLTFSCEANYNSNKLQKLSVFAGSSEILSYQPDKRPRVQWQNDETKSRFDFKKELSKTRTYIQMTLKKPKCHDQNIYKCIYSEEDKAPKMEHIRLDFYVDKGKVQMIDNRESDCAPLNITCIGQAGNPPEQIKWLKKRKGDSTYEPIEASYITSEKLAFHQVNCSNTRKEHFIYNPSVEETDLVIKCGFGDETEHMSFHSPVVFPENFEITAKPEGQHKVGEEIQLTCAGLGVTGMTKFKWFKKTKDSSDRVEIMPINPEQKFENADDMCHTQASVVIAYIPEINDEIIYCEAEDSGLMAKAAWAIQLGVISNPTDGITTKDTDDEETHKGNAEPEAEVNEDMTTSEPSSEEETDGDSKAETEPESEPDTTTMDKSLSEPVQQDSGQLRSCLSNVFLISSSLVVIAIQLLLAQSS